MTSDEELTVFLTEGLVLGGLWASSVGSGLQAIEVFRLRSFDLVIVDAAVQGFGGREVVRRLRGGNGREPVTDVPILMIAGNPDEITADEAQHVGADELLLPPIELEDLIPHLFQVVDAWRASHPDRPWADAAAQSG